MRDLMSFPNPVNENAARLVAGAVALTAAVALATGWYWLLAPLAYGFLARTLTGPTLSPLGRLAQWSAARLLGERRDVDGPPKRFAQAIGAVCTTAGGVGWLGFGSEAVAIAALAMMVVFATLESVFALCVGCHLFGLGARLGLIPAEICADCADLSRRHPALARR